MMRTTSEPNLSDAAISPAIQAEIGEQCPLSLQPLTTEKRKHAETDGSPQSKQPLPEKRTCVEIVEKPPESLPSSGEQNRCKWKCQGKGEFKGPIFSELPPAEQKRLMRFREKFGPLWPRSAMGSHNRNTEQIGENSSLYADSEQSNSQGSAVKDFTYCCSNPFEPLDFKGNHNFYSEVKLFGERAVTDFNGTYKRKLCFEDIQVVTSCLSSCNHHIVTIKVVDPCDKISVLVLRGMVHRGFTEANFQDFVILGAYKR